MLPLHAPHHRPVAPCHPLIIMVKPDAGKSNGIKMVTASHAQHSARQTRLYSIPAKIATRIVIPGVLLIIVTIIVKYSKRINLVTIAPTTSGLAPYVA